MGLNEDEWRSRGMERLGALRSELANINALLSNQVKPADAIGHDPTPSKLPLEETAELVKSLQQRYLDIHATNEHQRDRALVANQLLGQLVAHCANHQLVCTTMADTLKDLSPMRQQLSTVTTCADKLKGKLQALEQRIDQVALDDERRQFDEWKADQEQRWAMEVEQKRQAFKTKKEQMEQSYKDQEAEQTKKRVELYDVTFQAEMEDYRRRRETHVSSLYQVKESDRGSATTLENLRLDDHRAMDDLDSFLSDDEQDTGKSTSKTPLEEEDEDVPGVEILADEDYFSD
ncbi:hypothetical protein DM01DRAFT_307172 [Hesseltinella vesiculosa]|uniref:Uncharacterized protein n=1 Tax=Hesseltinella vesiculosa TaxID=101127 RepID=A0A1X2G4N0_9FUNG|nr:hypothetical protein DM01DRAFT_307172 [Hesseltinella vesiculosa]